MTEDEANTRWCPFVRLAADAGEWHTNRRHGHPDAASSYLCIGSACMAWRWDNRWTSRTEEGHGGDILIRLKRKPGEPAIGFCGLAGAPQ